jgi:CDP-glucose 4,6-dehydratase
LEDVEMSNDFWRGKRVFVTGHTGFKGGWLTLWLQKLGAEVYGYALAPPTEINLFTVAGVHDGMAGSIINDIRDFAQLRDALTNARPEVVFHLAAQPLVRYSYAEPQETYSTNVMGTVNLLEAVRSCQSVKAVVNVTTDKCYENREWLWGYREHEQLGGHDPYSSSKACSEIVTSAYRRSFLAEADIAVATARAGNVIGGGDWAADRLIPDCLNALMADKAVQIRNPHAIRPWQHVLEPLSGYLLLAQKMCESGAEYAEEWNFGPSDDDAKPVEWIVRRMCELWSNGARYEIDAGDHPHEAHYLKLDCSKAHNRLGWRPRWNLEKTLQSINEWMAVYSVGGNVRSCCLDQIEAYEAAGGGAT